MSAEQAAPCRHRGAPPDDIVNRVAELIQALGSDEAYLYDRGLSAEEFRLALPVAIEQMRGRSSASNSDRRDFLSMIFDHLVASKAITSYTRPSYGDETVYRLLVPGIGSVAVIQKGCPDGRHSSEAWVAPDWAQETYLWWLCDSLKAEPGWHVSAGVKRLRRQFFSARQDMIDGIIFHNSLCGTDVRPCPKIAHAVTIGSAVVPPPCVWVMPARGSGPNFNWEGSRKLLFPAALLSAFQINQSKSDLFTGQIGFQGTAQSGRTAITSRFGEGRVTTSRS